MKISDTNLTLKQTDLNLSTDHKNNVQESSEDIILIASAMIIMYHVGLYGIGNAHNINVHMSFFMIYCYMLN